MQHPGLYLVICADVFWEQWRVVRNALEAQVVGLPLSLEEHMNKQEAKALRAAPLGTPTDLSPVAVRDVSGALNALLADMFAIYFKTKYFHWHVSGRTFATITFFSTSSRSALRHH
jgi:hypothetical protein